MNGRNDGTARRGSSAGRRGFTLVELLLVLVILGVLAAVVVPKFTGRSEQAKIGAAKTDIDRIRAAISTFEVEASRVPTNDEQLSVLVENPGNVKDWHQTLEKIPEDPWGKPYKYVTPNVKSKAAYDLWSSGPDGQDGTDDDIGNW